MRLVLDTNIAISGLLWNGGPRSFFLDPLIGQIVLVTSLPLLIELEIVLRRSKFARRLESRRASVDQLVQGYASSAEIVVPSAIQPTVLRDLDDDQVLATAAAGSADLIVSGDKDLLSLRSFDGIRIVEAAKALALLR